MNNIVLIGMPGAGKSTIGVILAKVMGYHFVDTDLLIQKKENCLLKDIIQRKGLDGFLKIEDDVNAGIEVESSVIATGGSVVYGTKAMEHLRNIGRVVYIKLPYGTINNRLTNIKNRGVALKKGQTLRDLYEERCPLYEEYAHIIIEADGLSMEELVEAIEKEVKIESIEPKNEENFIKSPVNEKSVYK